MGGPPAVHVDHRPWGRFELLLLNGRASVKVLTVEPGARLSLQRHARRDEWWQMLDDGLEVEVDGQARAVPRGERAWVPRGAAHRVRNTGDAPARFLEIAFGDFDEDDIERLADDYRRA
ncbi:cupin domain-containing protein [Vallicoccus soli]|uniref:Cupin domain-containing protein n=1 Tax=Vallicoccus soli TaxID=2339232 RepID=A0A3A3ZNF2_9ACTN|nr:cupin domain-containing protein [Vallicoccus soli]